MLSENHGPVFDGREQGDYIVGFCQGMSRGGLQVIAGSAPSSRRHTDHDAEYAGVRGPGCGG